MSTLLSTGFATQVCPYIGLRYFTEADAQFFYGRDEHIVDLLGRLASHRFVAVLGASGSGKSSLVRAGLLPELRSGMIPHAGPDWKVVDFKPGRDPLGHLAAALQATLGVEDAGRFVAEGPLGIVRAVEAANLPRDTNIIIIADQFEEVFRFQREEIARGRGGVAAEECQLLTRRLLDATSQTDIPIHGLLIMRSDYLGECAQFPDLPERMSQSLFLAPRLRRDQLQEAITAPVGGGIEPALVQTLINDAGTEQDQLPRLQHLLIRMWNLANGGSITLDEYRRAGGWANGLEIDLNGIYDRLSEQQKDACRRIFHQLSELDKGRAVRRRVSLAELSEVCGHDTPEIVKAFECAGFLLVSSGVVDVTHECVLRCWSKSQKWLDEEIAARDFYIQLISRSKRHSELGRTDLREVAKLKQDGVLTRAWALRYGSADDFKGVERSIGSSRFHARALYGFILFLLVVLLALGIYTLWRAHAQEQIAKARELTADAAMSEYRDPAAALYLAAAAAQLSPKATPPGLEEVLVTALANGPSYGLLPDAGESVAWSPGGRMLAYGTAERAIRLCDASSGELLRTLRGHSDVVTSLAWSPDAASLASGSADRSIRIWNPATGEELLTLAGHLGTVISLAWSADGKALASGSADRTIRLWNVANGRAVRILTGHSDTVSSLAWSSDGKTLASASDDGTIRLWDAESGQELHSLTTRSGAVQSVSWSPDGRTLASAHADRTIRLWDTAKVQLLRTLAGHAGTVTSVAWNPDSKTLASASYDRTIRLWDMPSGQPVRALAGHSDAVTSLAWSPDGKDLASASDDGTIRLWNLASTRRVGTLLGHTAFVMDVAWSPDGKKLASASTDGTARLWNAANGRALLTLSGHSVAVMCAAWSPDGRTLASGGADRTVRLWETSSGQTIRTLSGHSGTVTTVAWSPDGQKLASGSYDGTIRLWDTVNGQAVRVIAGESGNIISLAWSPDGKTLASASDDGTVRLWLATLNDLLTQVRRHIRLFRLPETDCEKYLEKSSCPPL